MQDIINCPCPCLARYHPRCVDEKSGRESGRVEDGDWNKNRNNDRDGDDDNDKDKDDDKDKDKNEDADGDWEK